MLLTFFLTSLALSRIGRRRKRALEDIGKGGPRDAVQVLANGGIATCCALVYGYGGDVRWLAAFVGAYAAATADTWATEIGTLVRARPRSILTLRPVATGLSGGVTLAGTLASAAGAVCIAFAYLWFGAFAVANGHIPMPAWCWHGPCEIRGAAGFVVFVIGAGALAPFVLAGLGGSLADSLLGATAQELRRCEACGRLCETDPHACGAPTVLVRGVRGFSNDAVNLAATAAGALIAALTYWPLAAL